MSASAAPVLGASRWDVDRRYTALVEEHRQGGAPGPASDAAHADLVAEWRRTHGDPIPDYLARLGQDRDELDTETPS